MPEIIVTILQLLPATTGCGNFKTVSGRCTTAVSFGDKISNIWVAYSENGLHFLDQPPQNIPLLALLLILAVQSLVQVAG
jgi:hypothetical protein